MTMTWGLRLRLASVPDYCGFLGRTIVVQSLKLDDKQLDVVKMLLNKMWTDPLVGGVGSTISLTASWAAFVASVLVAATLLLSRRAGWVNMAALAGFGLELQTSHAASHGPIAFALLIVASGWLWWTRWRRGHSAKVA
jgi:hypothetical protein